MKVMVPISVVVLLLLLGFLMKSDTSSSVPKAEAVFEAAGVSLEPGPNWGEETLGPLTTQQTNGLCLPVLILQESNSVHVIKVFVTPFHQNPESTASILLETAAKNRDVVRDSIKKWSDFTSQNGIQVVHVSYDTQAREAGAKEIMRANVYLFRNKTKNCVIMNYISKADAESSSVDQMIRKTLTLN